jgi:hypothetical protein
MKKMIADEAASSRTDSYVGSGFLSWCRRFRNAYWTKDR